MIVNRQLSKNGFLSEWVSSRHNKTKWTDDKLEQIKQLKLNGLTYQKIADIMKTDRGSIHNLIIRNFPQILKYEQVPKNYIHINEFCELRNETYKSIYWKIRYKMDIDYLKINNKIYINRNAIIPNRMIKDEIVDKIIELYNQGLNKSKIALQLKINRKTVREYINIHKG